MSAPRTGERRRVLVVDDSADLGASMSAALDLLGYETRASADGHDALESMATWRPEIVFIDLTMPGFGGIEVLHAARVHQWGRAMFMIAMTGRDAEALRADVLAAGFDLFVEKPFDLAMLRTLLSPPVLARALDGSPRA